MTWFSYKALSKSGGEIAGEMEAPSRTAVIDWLLGLGHTPLSVEERGSRKAARRTRSGSGSDLTSRERLRITRELTSLLEAGVTLERALAIVSQVVTRPKARQLIASVLERLRGGQSFARALEASPGSFPPHYLGLVAAGEASGTLPQNLGRLATSLERSLFMRERITSALLYPALLLLMIGVTFVLLFTVVIPRLKPLFADAGVTLPLPTRIVLAIGDAVDSYGWFGLALLCIGGILAIEFTRLPTVRLALDHLVLRLPILLGIVAKSETASFTRTLGTLLDAGLTLPAALARAQDTVRNRAMHAAVGSTLKAVREGARLSSALARTRVFPRMSLELIRVGEEIAALPKMLLRTSEIYEREVETTVERLVALLVPVVTIGMGLIVGGLIASVLVGILSLNELAL